MHNSYRIGPGKLYVSSILAAIGKLADYFLDCVFYSNFMEGIFIHKLNEVILYCYTFDLHELLWEDLVHRCFIMFLFTLNYWFFICALITFYFDQRLKEQDALS